MDVWDGFDLKAVAHQRVKDTNYSNKRESFVTNFPREMIGVLGEKAFAIWAGLPPSTILGRKPKLFNFNLEGVRIDVRASEAAGYLAIPPKTFIAHKTAVDIYVLAKVSVEFETGELIGWCPYWMVEDRGKIFKLSADPEHKPSMNLDANHLYLMPTMRLDLDKWKQKQGPPELRT